MKTAGKQDVPDTRPTATGRILLFIPCYNCASQIGRVIGQLTSGAAPRFDGEVLVVDNGSKDGTVEEAVKALPALEGRLPAKVVRNLDNYNLGGSHNAAFAYAAANGFTHVLVLHGDDQGAIADIAPILEQGLHEQYDACLGSRFSRGSRLQGYSPLRILGNHVFNALFSIAAGRKVEDLGSGLNIFARSVFGDPDMIRCADDLRFNNYLLLKLFDSSRKIMFFPISWREDDQVSNVKMASQALKTLGVAGQYLFDRKAFRSTDHRAVKRDAYPFEVLSRSQP